MARVRVGTQEQLITQGRLVAKVGAHGVCVIWDDGRAYAVDDRCPHMGFPLHRGTVRDGLLVCHWHNARFDLASGGTLDPFADDVRCYPVVIDDGDVFIDVLPVPATDHMEHLRRRLDEGLEQGLTLVTAKAVIGLLEAGVEPADIALAGVRFGTTYRRPGWGAGLTVLVAMTNLLSELEPADRALALVHGLSFVSRDTRNHAPRFPLHPLGPGAVDGPRLTAWYRRFIETRSEAAAERVMTTAVAGGLGHEGLATMMTAAATDHVFLDGGHTIDFTNKGFEALDLLGWELAGDVLPALVPQAARAERSEEGGAWQHPHDLATMVRDFDARLPELLEAGAARGGDFDDVGVSELGWRILADDPADVVDAVETAITAGATPEQLGRGLALGAGLRIARFHIQNDFGDWDVVHHGFTAANALHQLLRRWPTPLLLRGVLHGALRVWLDRFLNIPAARLPEAGAVSLTDLAGCWDEQGGVDEAGAIAYGWLRNGGAPASLIAALGHALLSDDAEFHWYQTVEAAVRQFHAWPEGSEEGALILAGAARFLAAHTPTRRELPQVVRTATRLLRGEELYQDA